MPFRVDLHTHTIGSPDGALTAAHFRRMFRTGMLDCVAVTDHDSLGMAQKLQNQFGAERVIVGEEITTHDGEVIGLYLKNAIPAGLSAAEVVRRIKEQGGLVYIPHPFESVRKGIQLPVLEQIADSIDIIEVHNGRAIFQNRGRLAREWAGRQGMAMAASSDAHGAGGWGRTCSILEAMPTPQTLVTLLKKATLQQDTVGLRGILYPKFNRLRKRMDRRV
jgi:predicted metal-dependent phosphoesterase TrpH